MKRKLSPPATKEDIGLLMQTLGKVLDDTANLKQQVAESEERVLLHFDAKTERLVHDFQGIFQDRLEQHTDKLHDHETRIGGVERHLGLLHS